jgi:wyosine [tRNA(Phe)-imidazoG37] synthetase (radical SAM superfamily)
MEPVPADSSGGLPGIVFGPVPSRRLGRSLGINNVPPKTCSYACVYCQLGRTTRMQVERTSFHQPETVWREVERRLDAAAQTGEAVDYLTFVSDGEPTLDRYLGAAIDCLRATDVSIAVITNGSLLWREDVRRDLGRADWVSVKIDAADEETWRRVDRPHKDLRFDDVRDGMVAFAEQYDGCLVTETMLVGGVNDDEARVGRIAALVARLRPATAYVATPIRPPAESWVEEPAMSSLVAAYKALAESTGSAELLIGYEGNRFAVTGRAAESLLEITAVHPMREEAVDELLARTGASREVVRRLVADGRLVRLRHAGHTFYVRRLGGR